jgi:hypothetical protein
VFETADVLINRMHLPTPRPDEPFDSLDVSQPFAISVNQQPFGTLPDRLQELRVVCYGDFEGQLPLPFVALEERARVATVLGLNTDPRHEEVTRLYLREHADYSESRRLLVALFDRNADTTIFSNATVFAFGLVMQERHMSTLKIVSVNAKMQYTDSSDGRWGSIGIESREGSNGMVSVHKPIPNVNLLAERLHRLAAGRCDGSR